MSTVLTKQTILQVKDQRIERVEIPEWGGAVFVRSITAAERGQIEADAARYKDSKGKDESFARTFTLKFAVMGLCDENGVRLFDNGDVSELAKKNAAAIARVAEVAQRLSGFTKQDLEVMEKNSVSAPPEDSLSG
jgi:hypothetical protein